MTDDYWNDLNLVQKWSKKQRYNYILTYLHSQIDSETPKEEPKEKEPEVIKTGNVAVHVTDSEDEPIKDAVVTLNDNTNEFTCTTGSAGGCTMSNVPVGTYECTTEAEGYITSIDDYTVAEGDNTLEIVLDEETVEGSGGCG